jgi:hypothetical protein
VAATVLPESQIATDERGFDGTVAETGDKGCSSNTPVERVCLRDVKHSCRPRASDDLRFACVLVDLLALGLDERRYLDSMLASPYNTTDGFPRLERENILTWLDLSFGDTLRGESLKNPREIGERLTGHFAFQRFKTRCGDADLRLIRG